MDAFSRILQEYVDNKEGMGVSACITHKGKEMFRGTVGYADIESKRPFAFNSLVRIYSLTKMVISVTALRLWEQGLFQLDDPVHLFIPSFKDTKVLTYLNSDAPTPRPSTGVVTMRNLFTMTAGFAYPEIAVKPETPRRYIDGGAYSKEAFRQGRQRMQETGKSLTTLEAADIMAGIPMCFEPGEGWMYGMCADILGAVVVAISGKSLGEMMQEEIFTPLGMKDTTLYPTEEQYSRLATIYDYTNPARPVPFDLDSMIGAVLAPHAVGELEVCTGGLFSTLDDYSRFIAMLANDGQLDGARILGRKTVELMRSDHLAPQQYEELKKTWYPQGFASWGLMCRVFTSLNNARVMAFPGSFGWAGMAGTIACADPAENLSITVMTQRLPSNAYGVMSKLMQVAYSSLD